MNIGILFLAPIVVLLGPTAVLIYLLILCLDYPDCDCKFYHNKIYWIFASVVFLLLLPIVILIGAVVGVLAVVILIIPWIILQLYRILRICCYKSRVQ